MTRPRRSEYILAANGFSGIETVKDLSGLDRVVSARRRDNDV